jgi:PHP family Zn ribbon phosphoesterase
MTIPEIAKGARRKGIHLIGTGDATQPDWFAHLKTHLKIDNDSYIHESIAFVPTVEIEDCDSIHHLIILPDFEAAKALRKSIEAFSKNINHEWGGRPRANLNGEKLAAFVRDAGGLIGPAHAFTPFKSIFREGKYESLSACYGTETPHIHFLELGLSADSELADYIPELSRLTFITSSDAHSPSPDKLGREFVRFEMESPSFEELRLAILRKGDHRAVLNVGLNPRLGKYYLSFCPSCRRTLVFVKGDDSPQFDDLNIYISSNNLREKTNLLKSIHARKVKCPADGKALRLGVRDRARMIGQRESESPSHRPPYLDIPPLSQLITVALDLKSSNTKKAKDCYYQLTDLIDTEIKILTDVSCKRIESINPHVAKMI